MNKTQSIKFINSMMNKNIQNNENNKDVKDLFSKYDIDNDGLISFEDLNNFYSIKNKIYSI